MTRRQALELRDSRWDSDVEALIAVIERILAQAHKEDAPASSDISRHEARVAPTGTPQVGHMLPRKRWIGMTAVGLDLVAVVMAATGLLWSLNKGSEERASYESGLTHQALDGQSSPADSRANVTPLPGINGPPQAIGHPLHRNHLPRCRARTKAWFRTIDQGPAPSLPLATLTVVAQATRQPCKQIRRSQITWSGRTPRSPQRRHIHRLFWAVQATRPKPWSCSRRGG